MKGQKFVFPRERGTQDGDCTVQYWTCSAHILTQQEYGTQYLRAEGDLMSKLSPCGGTSARAGQELGNETEEEYSEKKKRCSPASLLQTIAMLDSIGFDPLVVEECQQ